MALIAQQVAGKAIRDALFLSSFHAHSLPLALLVLLAALNVLGAIGTLLIGGRRAETRASSVAEAGVGWGFGQIRREPFLRQITLFVAAGAVISTLLDYVFSARAEATFARG